MIKKSLIEGAKPLFEGYLEFRVAIRKQLTEVPSEGVKTIF